MSVEVNGNKEVTERWNLSDDDDYVDADISEDEEPENQLIEQVDELIKKIRSLLKGDNFSLELKEVPRYISSKQIEQFFEIDDPTHAEVEDPDPKNKRDVIVTFYNVDDFCNALRKNGKLIGSYTYVANYNPAIHRKQKYNKSNLKSKDSEHYEKRRSLRSENSYRQETGDVRKLDQAREYREHEQRNNKPRKGDSHKKPDHGKYSTYRSNSYSQTNRKGPMVHKKQETTIMESTNRFGFFNDDDDE